jgi:hypothetical protein
MAQQAQPGKVASAIHEPTQPKASAAARFDAHTHRSLARPPRQLAQITPTASIDGHIQRASAPRVGPAAPPVWHPFDQASSGVWCWMAISCSFQVGASAMSSEKCRIMAHT